LDRDVIEIIRDGHAKRAQKKAVREIAGGQLDALPSPRNHQKRKQHKQRKCDASLREYERINGTERRDAERQLPGENSAAQRR
jgi:hypothetical protein